ncbi:flagellar hook-associated protein FlgL [Herbivorax sp. ANBcel31]|uniref:flagellar hook-associated protein FlgL n=1 Tax=Herbivorax sp. ANBcel31 TaxID=3069754 RepID=UPI0027B282CC|nr:flagellar hook-associated protein FlgL [Herbivorax sp. ANBcel31]MDQ2085103.1 flagellar hook-associated protein FlgL [Herbivorax sp. ANBcel31]
MRVTNKMLINNMVNNIGTNLRRMEKIQDRLATGKKINVPSDDPVVASRALKLRTDVSRLEQYDRNVKDAMSWMEITESALGDMSDIFHRTRELSVQAANGSTTPEDTQKIEEEVKQLKTQLIKLGNSTYSGRYVFSGFKTDQNLLDEDGSFAIDVSNTQEITYEVGIGDDIHINLTGGDVFNHGEEAVEGDTSVVMEDFDRLITALNEGDHETISGLLGDIDNHMDNLSRVRADVGARYNRLELTENRLSGNIFNFTKLMSENEDIDQAENIMLLKSEENVYNASLAGGARVIQPSLMDFLR